MADEDQPDNNELRRSARLALTEMNVDNSPSSTTTPDNKTPSPDEMVIVQRGPRRKPITWSPVELHEFRCRSDGSGKISKKTACPGSKSELNPRLRRRLILSPIKHSCSLGSLIAKKLQSLPKLDRTVFDS